MGPMRTLFGKVMPYITSTTNCRDGKLVVTVSCPSGEASNDRKGFPALPYSQLSECDAPAIFVGLHYRLLTEILTEAHGTDEISFNVDDGVCQVRLSHVGLSVSKDVSLGAMFDEGELDHIHAELRVLFAKEYPKAHQPSANAVGDDEPQEEEPLPEGSD